MRQSIAVQTDGFLDVCSLDSAQRIVGDKSVSGRKFSARPASAVHDRDYSADETEFMQAMDLYKRSNQRPFPTWCEVLQVVRDLGYEKRS